MDVFTEDARSSGVTMREKHCSSKTGAQRSNRCTCRFRYEDQRRPCDECLEEGFTDEIVDIKLDEFQPLDEFLAFCDSSQEATPLQLIIAPCHVLVELWRATGCYQTCRKLALADLVKSSCAVV